MRGVVQESLLMRRAPLLSVSQIIADEVHAAHLRHAA